MLINLRNALMAGKRLPYDAEVEYLESTGTQWIDTGIKGNQTTSAELLGAWRDITNDNPLFAADNGNTFTGAFSLSTWSGIRYVRGGISRTSSVSLSSDVVYDIACSPSGVSVNGVYDAIISTPDFETNGTIPLFAWNRSGTIIIKSKCRIYSAKFYQNNILVRDFIPVRVGQVGYLYDRVSGKLFGNAGTGDFVLGPDVVPVEYIESHGTEWIDTDKSVDLPMHLEADINFTNPNTGSNVQTFVGGYNSDLTNQRFWVTSLPQGRINCGLLTNSISANLVPANKKVHLVVDFENGRQVSTIDGVQYTSASQSTTNYWFRNWKLRIFQSFGTVVASNNIPLQAITNRIDIDIGGSQALRLRPVRVGTEGAMMDTLTRRIYRNAGTGAFAYGNDLPYPIPAS